MRDLAFFERKDFYVDYLRSHVFTENWVWECPFYANLISWVVDHRAPIFYTVSDPSEHFAFSGAYHFETRRERYPNKTREILFWLHDFTHILFPYSHDLLTTTEEWFTKQFIRQERAASNETEILAYYRVPHLRDRIFKDETLYYDVLVKHGVTDKPGAVWLWEHRDQIVMNDEYGERVLEEYPDILRFFRQWRVLTPRFCNERYRSMAGIRVPRFHWRRLSIESYEHAISNYVPSPLKGDGQDEYERIVLANLQMAYAILGWDDPPIRWRHAPDAVAALEGAVFFQR
jgi:hypothetical protein